MTATKDCPVPASIVQPYKTNDPPYEKREDTGTP